MPKNIKEFFKPIIVIFLLLFVILGYFALNYWIIEYQSYLRMKADGQFTACCVFTEKLGKAIEEFGRRKGHFPVSLTQLRPDYIKHIPTCPAAQKTSYAYIVTKDKDRFTVFCKGNYHRNVLSGKDFPMYSSKYGLIERESKLKKIKD